MNRRRYSNPEICYGCMTLSWPPHRPNGRLCELCWWASFRPLELAALAALAGALGGFLLAVAWLG